MKSSQLTMTGPLAGMTPSDHESIRADIFAGMPLANVYEKHGSYETLRALGAGTIQYDTAEDVNEELANTAARDHRRQRFDHALQFTIAGLSLFAAYLVALPSASDLQKWGYVVGLCSQPFWLLSAGRARQWGIILNAVFYTGAWVQGIFNHF